MAGTNGVVDERVASAASDGIVTPEAVVLDLETAGVASRALAGIIDLFVQVGLLFVGSIVIGMAGLLDSSAWTAFSILLAFITMGYPVLFEMLWRGQTIGKRSMGLRAITVEGAPVRLRHVMLRMMGGLVDRYLPPIGVTGVLLVLGTSRHQRVGDLLAGTIVVRDPGRSFLPQAVWFPVPQGLEQYAATIDPTAMTDAHYTVIRSFLVRNRELSPDARYALALDLAGRIAAVVRHERPRHVHPESFLLCVISRYQRANFARR
jgi:uncharacterized RDD family membrane protein YckC